jgi:hypothetical protein
VGLNIDDIDSQKTPPASQTTVRVLQAGWYGPSGTPVNVGDVFAMPTPSAVGAQQRGLVEFA